MSAESKVCSSQEHLLIQTGTEDFHEVEEKDDEDSDDQCAFPDKESLHLSGLSLITSEFTVAKSRVVGLILSGFSQSGNCRT